MEDSETSNMGWKHEFQDFSSQLKKMVNDSFSQRKKDPGHDSYRMGCVSTHS